MMYSFFLFLEVYDEPASLFFLPHFPMYGCGTMYPFVFPILKIVVQEVIGRRCGWFPCPPQEYMY